MENTISATVKALRKNGFVAEYFPSAQAALESLFGQLRQAKSISRGGSVTLEKMGVFDQIKAEKLPFRDYQTPEDRLASLGAQFYLTGSNAVTQDGALVNIDGAGNRVAALAYGPEQVFVVVGTNKLVPDVAAGFKRIRNFAGPLNAKRLNRKTPCVSTLRCMDCASSDRICRKKSIIDRPEPGRIHVLIVEGDWGL